MSNKRMLIDASHPEETRVVIVNGNKIEDLDVEVASRRPLKGNIYLAKITRVEPSLQAAFIDYGGNRHGFLAFNEIHPDYYQIPVADREALLADEEIMQRQRGAEEDEKAIVVAGNGEDTATVEELGGDELSYESGTRRLTSDRKRYKIQEVIKRRQILLVQVVKEERGTKGAALTTYLSLAGRYCVLMPNTARGGGISRKIANSQDRKRLKTILNNIGIMEGMAVIVRTAGSKRSKVEIKRDYEYLSRLWEQIRELTLNSIAPCLIHEEGNLIKRSIRDLYSKDIDEIIIDGEEGYRLAKDFMKLLIPSHAKRVQPNKDSDLPLMQRYQIPSQLEHIDSPEVNLKSGGYIVINPTEALVSIDVNSGRSTRERHIEETALKTNIEAAEEIARQLRLRDLAGLIVIDFIDMEINRNQIKVEKALKEAMRSDRARIKIGRISPFGLLELSRQRLRPSLIETTSEVCPHCGGTGTRRSTDSTALQMLRVIEEEAMRRRSSKIILYVPASVALYILNFKRPSLAELEQTYETTIYLKHDDNLIPPNYRMEKVRTNANAQSDDKTNDTYANQNVQKIKTHKKDKVAFEKNGANLQSAKTTVTIDDSSGEEEKLKPKRRRRGRRGGQKKRPLPNQNNGNTFKEENSPSLQPSDMPTSTKTRDLSKKKTDGSVIQNAPISSREGTNGTQAVELKRNPSKPQNSSSKPKIRNDISNSAEPDQKKVKSKASIKIKSDAKLSNLKNTLHKPRQRSLNTAKKKDSDNTRITKTVSATNKAKVSKTNEAKAKNPTAAEEIAAAEAARTNVINVGSKKADNNKSRRGWWRRSVS